MTSGRRPTTAGISSASTCAASCAGCETNGGRSMPEQVVELTVTVNGREYTRAVEARMHLADFLREELGLAGTHIGCEQGVCGNCTVLVEGQAVKSCLMLAP